MTVLETSMHYVEMGSGPTVVFLHGNPTSSILWRNVTPLVAASGFRCIAIDLIGMGQSGKSDRGYRLTDHISHVEAFLDALDLSDVTFVGHDWGAVIALDIARRHAPRIHGVAFMEGHIHPIEQWSDMDEGGRQLFSALRTVGVGERLVLEDNIFIEVILPSGTDRELEKSVMDMYRKPFTEPSSRTPMLQWAREIPIAGEPADVVEIVTRNRGVISDPAMPTLLLHGTPGSVIGASEIASCRSVGRALTVVDVGPGTHFLPEDQPGPIADALLQWLLVSRRPDGTTPKAAQYGQDASSLGFVSSYRSGLG